MIYTVTRLRPAMPRALWRRRWLPEPGCPRPASPGSQP